MTIADAQQLLATIAAQLSGHKGLCEQLGALVVQKAADKLGDIERESRDAQQHKRA